LDVVCWPQATGKSILLQLIKLLLDSQIIFYTYEKKYFWEEDINNFIEFYFGEGMKSLWIIHLYF